MYADDLVLLSISLTHMKMMVDVCVKEFLDLGMEINIKKSGCVRIGARHDAETDTLVINNMILEWKNDTKYLGAILFSAKRFSFNSQVSKQKYYRAINGIFGKIGMNISPAVLCSLINSFGVPVFMYICI